MTSYVRDFFKSDNKTKYFILTLAVYSLALILTTVYCYARLDFVRSGQSSQNEPGEIIGYQSN